MVKNIDTGDWLESKVRKLLKECNIFNIKPMDFKSLTVFLSKYPHLAKQVPQSPCDRMCIYKGMSIWLEMKHVIGKSLPFDRIKTHQISNLRRHEEKGEGKSFVVIGIRHDSLGKRSHIYFVPIMKIIDYVLSSDTDRKSFPLDWIIDNGIYIKVSDDLLIFFGKLYKTLN